MQRCCVEWWRDYLYTKCDILIMCVPCQLSEYIFPHFLPLSSNRNSHAQGHVRLIPCEIKISYERPNPDPMNINLKIPTAKKTIQT